MKRVGFESDRLRTDAFELTKTGLVDVIPKMSDGAVSLEGTLAISYRGNQYNIPIELQLPSYPDSPPICFVRPTESMLIKKNHRDVDEFGRMTLDYLREWNAGKSSLVGLCEVASIVYSKKPPLFSAANVSSWKEKLTKKIQKRLVGFYENATTEVNVEFKAQASLQKAQQKTHAKTNPKQMRDELKEQLSQVEETEERLRTWIDVQLSSPAEARRPEIVPKDAISGQLLGLIAEINAIEDVLYQLDRFLQDSHVNLDDYLREIRRLASKQFLLKAHVFKVYDEQKRLLDASNSS